jgi:hypothetical protein
VDAQSFPYDRYLSVKEQRDSYLQSWAAGERPHEVPVVFVFPAEEFSIWGAKCASREMLLAENLRGLALSAAWAGDSVFPHLEPWHGVGVYANAFGCKYLWTGYDAPQTLPIYQNADELRDVRKPDPADSEIMNMVLETIRYFRRETHDLLPICLTDTQSPNDTASLILRSDEFFLVSSYEPERLERFMNAVTDLMIEFSELQMKAIGPHLTHPGHNMLSHVSWPGISISDDNMSFLSPKAYRVATLPYNSRLARHFGGLGVHSCGQIAHNIPLLLQTPALFEVDCHLAASSDPNPNRPEEIRDAFRGTNVIVKVSVEKEDWALLPRLLAPGLRCVLEVYGVQTRAESDAVYARYKEEIASITATW